MIWDPSPILFQIPYLGIPIGWYGILFASGFFCGYRIFVRMCQDRELADRLLTYVLVGTVFGSRLGHVLFYEDALYYLAHPWLILKTWEGGLASHGGIAGIMIALVAFARVQKGVNWLQLVDQLTVPSCFAGVFIRMGNFVNQEILGTASDLPWSVVFGSPIDGSVSVARHPVQIYEALFYLSLGLVLYAVWKRRELAQGILSGLFFSLMFTFRFLIEFLKETQSVYEVEGSILMGQWLSIPFIVFGIGLLWWSRRRSDIGVLGRE